MKFLIAFVLVLVSGVLSDKIRGRVFGGNDANNADFKYLVRYFVPSVHNKEQFTSCGGSLIHNRWILTVAHCFNGGDREGVIVFLGLDTTHTYTQIRPAIKVITHQNYFRSDFEELNDIALIKIRHVKYNEYKQRIPLSPLASFDGEFVTVAGWGVTDNARTYPTNLQYTTLKVLSSPECSKIFSRYHPITQFCTFTATRSLCDGDSGSPAVIDSGPNAQLIGLVSYTLEECSENNPMAYTRIYSYLPWIKNETNIKFKQKSRKFQNYLKIN